jgi:hypothetical protein
VPSKSAESMTPDLVNERAEEELHARRGDVLKRERRSTPLCELTTPANSYALRSAAAKRSTIAAAGSIAAMPPRFGRRTFAIASMSDTGRLDA